MCDLASPNDDTGSGSSGIALNSIEGGCDCVERCCYPCYLKQLVRSKNGKLMFKCPNCRDCNEYTLLVDEKVSPSPKNIFRELVGWDGSTVLGAKREPLFRLAEKPSMNNAIHPEADDSTRPPLPAFLNKTLSCGTTTNVLVHDTVPRDLCGLFCECVALLAANQFTIDRIAALLPANHFFHTKYRKNTDYESSVVNFMDMLRELAQKNTPLSNPLTSWLEGSPFECNYTTAAMCNVIQFSRDVDELVEYEVGSIEWHLARSLRFFFAGKRTVSPNDMPKQVVFFFDLLAKQMSRYEFTLRSALDYALDPYAQGRFDRSIKHMDVFGDLYSRVPLWLQQTWIQSMLDVFPQNFDELFDYGFFQAVITRIERKDATEERIWEFYKENRLLTISGYIKPYTRESFALQHKRFMLNFPDTAPLSDWATAPSDWATDEQKGAIPMIPVMFAFSTPQPTSNGVQQFSFNAYFLKPNYTFISKIFRRRNTCAFRCRYNNKLTPRRTIQLLDGRRLQSIHRNRLVQLILAANLISPFLTKHL